MKKRIRVAVLALLLIGSALIGVRQGIADCAYQFSQGHDAMCYTLGSCNGSYFVYCILTTCSVDGNEASQGCTPSTSQGCIFGACFISAVFPTAGCGGCPSF